MLNQKHHQHFAFELWASRGSWFWRLSSRSDGRGIVGVACSADAAARDACESLEEIEPANGVIVTAPMLLESALALSGVLEGFERRCGARGGI